MIEADVWSDLVCPWCYLGRANLRAAQTRAGVDLRMRHRAFQLAPQQTRSMLLEDWFRERYGPQVDVDAMTGRVRELGRAAGLDLRFDRAIVANTRDAHRLVALAQEAGLGEAAVERFMKAHFTEGLDLGDAPTLVRLAAEVGLEPARVERVLATRELDDLVARDVELARRLGVRGVPFFVFDGRQALSGAQPVDVFERVLQDG